MTIRVLQSSTAFHNITFTTPTLTSALKFLHNLFSTNQGRETITPLLTNECFSSPQTTELQLHRLQGRAYTWPIRELGAPSDFLKALPSDFGTIGTQERPQRSCATEMYISFFISHSFILSNTHQSWLHSSSLATQTWGASCSTRTCERCTCSTSRADRVPSGRGRCRTRGSNTTRRATSASPAASALRMSS